MEKSSDRFRLLYDVKGRFVLHEVGPEEAKYKLCRVVGDGTQAKGVPYLITHDGRTLRYPDPLIKKHDVLKLDLETGKVRRGERGRGSSAPPERFSQWLISWLNPHPAPPPHLFATDS